MLGMIAGDGQYRPEQHYRYSVRADRAQARAIERAAARAGKSVERFVQEHFELILDHARRGKSAPASAPEAPAEMVDRRSDAARLSDGRIAELIAGPGAPRADDGLRASDLGISLPSLRLLRVVSAIADEAGFFVVDVKGLSAVVGSTANVVTRTLNDAIRRGWLERIARSEGHRAAMMRVVKREV